MARNDGGSEVACERSYDKQSPPMDEISHYCEVNPYHKHVQEKGTSSGVPPICRRMTTGHGKKPNKVTGNGYQSLPS